MLTFFTKIKFNCETPAQEAEVITTFMKTRIAEECTVYTIQMYRMEKQMDIIAFFYDEEFKEKDKDRVEDKFFDEIADTDNLMSYLKSIEVDLF